MKQIKKGFIVTTFILLCITCAIIILSRINITPLFTAAGNNELKGAIFEREGKICFFDYSERKITIIDGGGKYNPLLSPDKTRILYRRSASETEGNVLRFGIIDLNGKTILDIAIDSGTSNDIIGCQWLSDTAVGITTHVNPSTSEFFVYDAANGKMTGHYIGYSFAQVPNTEIIIHAKNVPHWSDEPVCHSFEVNGKTVYTSDVLNAKLCPPVFSGDLTKIAFMEQLPGPGDKSSACRIITADFDKDNIAIRNIDCIDVPAGISGDLTFDSNNNVCVVNGNLLHTYDRNTSSFIQTLITTDLQDNESESEFFAELQKAIKEYWSDDSPDKINSINLIYENAE